jgi:hypothetical protein
MSTGLSRVESQKKRRLEEKQGKKQGMKSKLQGYLFKKGISSNLEDNIASDEVIRSDNDIIPARTETYLSNNAKVSRVFLNTLIFLFVVLTFALLWWGLEGAPPLKEIWK